MKHRPRSQPRLAGSPREPRATCVPPHVTKALRAIALREDKSLSWVTAQIVYDYLGLDETGWYAKNERRRA
jgi:hypothetical protein